jgi:hypothetical protein
MKKIFVLICVCCSLIMAALSLAEFPQAEISNGLIQATLYLPDKEKGYYQGTRFDWSGVVASLEYKGHQYFGPWLEKHDPKLHEAISGPVEEFVPLSYEETKVGEAFVKIGVGTLRKLDESKYHFAKPYEIVNAGKRSVKTKKDQVEFVHELTDAAGYSYIYQKTLRLTKGKPELVLEHSLKNTGKRTIETNVYNHNFFVIDKQPTGPEIVTTFPFDIQIQGGLGKEGLAEIRGNQLIYLRELNKGEHVFNNDVQGFGSSAKDYDFRIENRKSGAGVRITSDQPLSKIVFWASSTTSCPEPYIQLRAEPGKEFKWKIFYEFYTIPASAANK